MRFILNFLIFLFFAEKVLFAQNTLKPPWEYGAKDMVEISGNISGWYETGYSSKSVLALAYPELGYFFKPKWYASTSTAFEYFYTEYKGGPYPTSNLNISPNLGIGRVFTITSAIYFSLHGAIGGEYVYCFYQHCSSSWINGLKVVLDPTVKFLLKESVLLNVTWGIRNYFDLSTGLFSRYFKTAIILGLSYAF